MAPRANWKGFLKVGEVTCPVALYSATSSSARIAFHTVNRATGHRVRRQFIDSETGAAVATDDQVKGYEVSPGDFVMLEPEEVAAAVPDSDKTLTVSSFVGHDAIDDVYFDKPYYLAPSDRYAEDAYVLIREGLRAKKVAALAQAVLFRRVRTLLIRPLDRGLIASTLNFDYEVRAASEVFDAVPALKIKAEMRTLAEHIIKTKSGTFDPSEFDDRYEAALAELVKAKLEGKTIEVRKERPRAKVVDLMAALRQSAELGRTGSRAAGKAGSSRAKAKAAPARRKAG